MILRRLPCLSIVDQRPGAALPFPIVARVRALAGDDPLPRGRIVVDIIRADGLSDDELAAVVLREIRAAAAGL